jgi:hypothetical protein
LQAVFHPPSKSGTPEERMVIETLDGTPENPPMKDLTGIRIIKNARSSAEEGLEETEDSNGLIVLD